MAVDWKYDEGRSLRELEDYVGSTYSAHYVRDDLTVFDIWKSQGSMETTARDTAQKYLARYGRKNGKDKKDLLKALHYILLMMHMHNQESAAREECPPTSPGWGITVTSEREDGQTLSRHTRDALQRDPHTRPQDERGWQPA